VYFRLAALAAGVSPEALLKLSDPLGILVQAQHDRESGDERLLGLPDGDVEDMIDSAMRELRIAAQEVPEQTRPVVDGMVGYVVTK
jgi:hypothetical protein